VLVTAFLAGSFFFFLGSLFSFFSLNHKSQSGNVAIVEVIGGIFESGPVVEELIDLKKDKSVKAVVLRIDSPGGSVAASQEIFEAVKDLKTEKPVVVSMGSVAASGGYYIAAPATRIIANEGTVTGSIGVRMEYLNIEDLLQWAKLKPVTLKSGKLKDIASPLRPMTPEERKYLEGILKEMHEQFKKAVAESRGLTKAQIDRIADGRVFTGADALKEKLVDELGSQERAVKVAGELAHIKGEPEIFYPTPDKKFWETVIDGTVDRVFEKVSARTFTRFSYD
jgi:protease-4